MKRPVLLFMLLLAAVLFAGTLRARSRSLISGTVIDARTMEPVYLADVFLSNTTLGCATTDQGRFSLSDVPLGTYEMVIHHIGYEPKIVHVDVLTAKQLDLNIEIDPRVLPGEVVEIVGTKEREWNRYFQRFNKALLGETGNAAQCTFLNPDVIRFNEDGDVLRAASDSVIHIRNDFLGYQIGLIIQSFFCSGENKKYQIFPMFRPLQSGDAEQRQCWRKNRFRVYQGSFRHMLAALYHEHLDDEGWELYEVKHVAGKIYTWGSTDRVREYEPLIRDSDFPELKEVRFDGHYMVLSSFIPRKTDRFIEKAKQANFIQLELFEPSFFSMSTDMALIDCLGNIHTPYAFTLSGYWGIYGVADMLPFDYVPDNPDNTPAGSHEDDEQGQKP
ncbi:carboxypeptidase-like regulatory domain-containing protein [bacterium]|nr:carboxypeptidase-like regulatory domain-containing protein [bacterium]